MKGMLRLCPLPKDLCRVGTKCLRIVDGKLVEFTILKVEGNSAEIKPLIFSLLSKLKILRIAYWKNNVVNGTYLQHGNWTTVIQNDLLNKEIYFQLINFDNEGYGRLHNKYFNPNSTNVSYTESETKELCWSAFQQYIECEENMKRYEESFNYWWNLNKKN